MGGGTLVSPPFFSKIYAACYICAMDKEINTGNPESATEQSREEKIAAMKAALSANFTYLTYSDKYDEAMDKMARYAVDVDKKADKIAGEFNKYKAESIILKVDTYDNQKIADDVLSNWKWEHPKGDVALIAQHIGRTTAVSKENPKDVAERFLSMGFDEAFAMTKREKKPSQQKEYDPKVQEAIVKKAAIAKEVAEYMWPGSGENYKSDVEKHKFCAAIARESVESKMPFESLVVKYYGMKPELASASLKEYMEGRQEAGDRRTQEQKTQAELAGKYTKTLNEGIWPGVKGASAQDKSSFVGKVSWHCVFNGKKPEEFIEKYKGMSPKEALADYVAKVEKKPVAKVEPLSQEEVAELKKEWEARTERAVALLCPESGEVSPAINQLAQALATDSMDSGAPIEKLAGEYAKLKLAPDEKFKLYRQNKAESLAEGKEVEAPAKNQAAALKKRVISR